MSMTLRLMAFVKDRPNQIIPATEFEQFGRQSWRTRLAEARKKFESANDGTIEYRPLYKPSHQDNCPAIQAWDVEGACNCGKSKTLTLSRYVYVPARSAEPIPPVPQGHDVNGWNLR